MDQKAESNTVKKIMSPCDVEALKKCLEENKGDYVKCQSQIEAFKSSCSIKKPNPSQESAPPLNSGVLSDLWQSKLFTLNHNSHLGICFFIGFLVLYVIFAEYLDLKFWAIVFFFFGLRIFLVLKWVLQKVVKAKFCCLNWNWIKSWKIGCFWMLFM